MASFTDLIAQRILQRRKEFLVSLSTEPDDQVEYFLAAGIQAHWHTFKHDDNRKVYRNVPDVAAVDGSRAIRALSIGADWIIAQALLIGPNGIRLSAADTRLLRGDIESQAVDRCASLLMRSLELELALKYVQSETGNLLLLDGSLYADLPYLLYNLAIGGYEDLPMKVLGQYLELFDLCEKNNVLLLGISKSTRSTALGRAILEESHSYASYAIPQSDSLHQIETDVRSKIPFSDLQKQHQQRHNVESNMKGLPSDGELLQRWTQGIGLTDPVLLGSASFGHNSVQKMTKLATRAKQIVNESYDPQLRSIQQKTLERLLTAPAIGTFYVRLAPGDDVLRVDALASTFGRKDIHLLEFAQILLPHTTASPIIQHLLDDYGGLSVYNAALYVVDQEVRLHADTVDHIYLPVLRNQLGHLIRYDRSTRRFIH